MDKITDWDISGRINGYGFDLKYDRYFEERFYIPFIRDRIKWDFGIDYNVPTHIKLLLRLK